MIKRGLVFLLLLLLPVLAEADPVQLNTGGYVHILYKDDAGCVAYQKEGHPVTMTCPPSPCELKMKEAMKEIDEILRLNHGLLMDRDHGKPRMCLNLSQNAYRQWERVMKECVQ